MAEADDRRLWRVVLALLVIADVMILLSIALRPLPIVDNLTMPDDAYLALGVARNIALGKGPLQGLAYTNGFQPLYVFLMVPVFRVWQTDLMTPVRVAHLLLSAFNVATLLILTSWLRRMTGSTLAALVVGVAWVFDWYTIYMSLNGLETAVSVCFIVASLATFHRVVEEGESRLLTRLGWLLGFAVVARIDNLLLVATLGLVLVVQRKQAEDMLHVAWPIVFVSLPWWLYSYHYTGQLYPVSGDAVRFRSLSHVGHAPTFDNYYWPMIERAARDIRRSNTELLVGVGVAVAIGLVRSRAAARAPLPRWTLSALGIWAAAMFAAYTGYIFGPWYFTRYFYPLIVPILVLLAFALRMAVQESRGLAALAAVALMGALVQRSQFRTAFTSVTTTLYGYMNVGLWARDQFPPGTRVGAVQSGALGYFAPDLTVVNLDGVVNQECFLALRRFREMDYVQRPASNIS